MPIVSIPHVFQGKRRCDYCHRPTNRLYQIDLGGMNVWVCSGAHAEMARRNYQEKIDKNIRPGEPLPPQSLDEEVDINSKELGEESE